MAQAAFLHFGGLLGIVVVQDRTLNLEQLIDTLEGLEDLEESFTKVEVWNTIKRLSAHKASGPDGFTVEFLCACWGIVKQDFMALFQQLYDLRGRGFHVLNQALLTLLPKQPDAQALGDFRPISVIHLVAKVFAKV
jgi:hypothetical protein